MAQCIGRALQNMGIEQALRNKENLAECDVACNKQRKLDERELEKICMEQALQNKGKKELSSHDPCDLTCTKKKKRTSYLEYVGPVHIAIVDPPAYKYRQIMCETSSMIMAYFTMGAAVMPVLWYTLEFEIPWPLNLHIMLYTIAYQLLMPSGFLMMSSYDGASLWMKERSKQMESALLTLVASLFIVFGSLSLAHFLGIVGSFERPPTDMPEVYVSLHSVLGMITVACSVVNFGTLFCSFFPENSTLMQFLRFACVPAFLLSSITFITGVYKFSLVEWLPEDNMCHFIVVYCVYYTVIAIKGPILIFLRSF